MQEFQKVKENVRIEDYIATTLGRHYKGNGKWLNGGICPFCQGNDCFRIDTNGQNFICFKCDVGGDVITFSCLYHNLNTNYEGLLKVAEFGGIDIQHKNIERESQNKNTIFRLTSDFLHENLLSNEQALSYLIEKRCHSLETIKKFKLGYITKLEALPNHLYKHGFNKNDLIRAGILKIEDEITKPLFPCHVYIHPWFINNRIGHFSFKDSTKKCNHQLENEFKDRSYLFYNQGAMYRTPFPHP